jgi:hypothetical protein
MTLEQIKAMRPKMERRKIDATTETDIARHMREDREASSTSAFAPGEE